MFPLENKPLHEISERSVIKLQDRIFIPIDKPIYPLNESEGSFYCLVCSDPYHSGINFVSLIQQFTPFSNLFLGRRYLIKGKIS